MRTLYQLLSLAPAPLFFIGFLVNVFTVQGMCSAWPYEMAFMWFVMMLAHTTPWILFWQQRDFTRN
jgi:hypothetical protein